MVTSVSQLHIGKCRRKLFFISYKVPENFSGRKAFSLNLSFSLSCTVTWAWGPGAAQGLGWSLATMPGVCPAVLCPQAPLPCPRSRSVMLASERAHLLLQA